LNCAQNMRAPIDEAKQTFQIESSRILRRWTELVNNEEARAVRDASESHAPTSSSGNEDAAQYAFVRTLGRGSEGSVEEVREVTTGSVFARKQVLFTAYSSDKSAVERKVRNEVEIMKKLKHLHIASVCFWLKTSESCDIYMTPVADDNLFVFLEGCTTSGYDQAKLNMMIPWFGCLLSALAFAQRCHIVHQDIKPSNILIQGGQVYLADFGESKDFSDHETSNPSNADVCGTPIYRAPEVTPSHRRSYPADVFSLGCVFSEMLTVCARRSTADYREARYNKENESPRAFRTSLSRVTKWIRGLDCDEHLEGSLKIQIIPKMLKEDPSQRKTARQLWDLLRQLDSGEDFRLYCTYH
jgi:serine/threonine protein kinase